jgi:hypothetical protein
MKISQKTHYDDFSIFHSNAQTSSEHAQQAASEAR